MVGQEKHAPVPASLFRAMPGQDRHDGPDSQKALAGLGIKALGTMNDSMPSYHTQVGGGEYVHDLQISTE